MRNTKQSKAIAGTAWALPEPVPHRSLVGPATQGKIIRRPANGCALPGSNAGHLGPCRKPARRCTPASLPLRWFKDQ